MNYPKLINKDLNNNVFEYIVFVLLFFVIDFFLKIQKVK
jgi:hypothetical protein